MFGVLPTLSGAGLRRCTVRNRNPKWHALLRISVTSRLKLASNMVGVYRRQFGAPDMRKWTMPLTLLGLGGLGYLFLSERGQQALRWVAENVSRGPEKFLEWNESAQRELDRIQEALNRVADSLQASTIESQS
jgi:hypothetical protein